MICVLRSLPLERRSNRGKPQIFAKTKNLPSTFPVGTSGYCCMCGLCGVWCVAHVCAPEPLCKGKAVGPLEVRALSMRDSDRVFDFGDWGVLESMLIGFP
eukprot:scaffold13315_cov115-Isochrysis_galbana.AAC.13